MTTRTTVTIPEGLDLNDRDARQRVEAGIKKNLGQNFEILWPRPKEKSRDVVAVDSRPGLQRVTLGPDVRPTMGGQVFAKLRTQGLQMVEFDPYGGFALACTMDEQTIEIRNRLAAVLKCEPWALEVVCDSIFDEKLGRDRLDKVCLVKIPSQGISAEKRLTTWRELIVMLKDGGTGWAVEEDSVSGQVQLSYGAPPRLHSLVRLAEIGLEPVIRRDLWNLLPIGLNPSEKVISIDLKAGPHMAFGGATGTGKSGAIRTVLAGALLHGADIVVIDPKKNCGDFKAFEPYAVAWGDDESLEQTADIMDVVYGEGQRRKAILKSLGLPNVWELSQAERQEHGIKPLLMIFDEFQSSTLLKDVPKGLKNDDPLVKRPQRHNYNVARIKNVAQSGVLELRSVGIHFGFAGQVVSAEAFGSTLRANLSSVVVCIPRVGAMMPKREILGLQFGDSANAALELIDVLNTPDPGLGLTMGESGSVDGCRIAFAEPPEITELLISAGVPEPERWNINARLVEARAMEDAKYEGGDTEPNLTDVEAV